ncbi:hypothetical protein CL653_01550 [bacterium]|nr:hypothetical protein [bacterium]|tara:strand:+ start:446 stop:754 length:309 start_codon:yes stop_codon:yes gene_type:complete
MDEQQLQQAEERLRKTEDERRVLVQNIERRRTEIDRDKRARRDSIDREFAAKLKLAEQWRDDQFASLDKGTEDSLKEDSLRIMKLDKQVQAINREIDNLRRG